MKMDGSGLNPSVLSNQNLLSDDICVCTFTQVVEVCVYVHTGGQRFVSTFTQVVRGLCLYLHTGGQRFVSVSHRWSEVCVCAFTQVVRGLCLRSHRW